MGEVDMGALLGGMMGANASPEMQQALQMLGPMIQQLQRQQQGNGPPPRNGAPAAPQGGSAVDPDVQRMLQQMIEGL
jgi:hypothetical protein